MALLDPPARTRASLRARARTERPAIEVVSVGNRVVAFDGTTRSNSVRCP